MEIASISPDFDFTINPSHTKKSFLIPAKLNGINNLISATAAQFELSDIEMVTFQTSPYTSLKDLLPTSPSSVQSPTNNSRRDSWREIPIKDPLVQHAAWAYLQPMITHPEADNRNLAHKLKDNCCAVFGCFNDVVLVMIRNWLSGAEPQDNNAEEDNS